MKIHDLLTNGAGGIMKFKYVCLGLFYCVCGLISLSYDSFYGFKFVDWSRFYFWVL